ncbi:MAG: 50S ribosomal protein L28 [Parcubacteria group bacterium]|nr:50S ribosomal protein L28 [Parcubacteria group bacterium]
MAKVCAICGKQYNTATTRVKTRSAYNPTSRHRQKANLQWYRLANGKRIKVCTSCLKKLSRNK